MGIPAAIRRFLQQPCGELEMRGRETELKASGRSREERETGGVWSLHMMTKQLKVEAAI